MKKNPNYWNEVRDNELVPLFERARITRCEVCGKGWPLGFAHSLRRKDIDAYLAKGNLEGYEEKMRNVVKLCQPCHLTIDSNKRYVSEQLIENIIAKRGFDINEL